MSKDHVGDEPLNLALARTPPAAATCADFCSRAPATQIGDMPLCFCCCGRDPAQIIGQRSGLRQGSARAVSFTAA